VLVSDAGQADMPSEDAAHPYPMGLPDLLPEGPMDASPVGNSRRVMAVLGQELENHNQLPAQRHRVSEHEEPGYVVVCEPSVAKLQPVCVGSKQGAKAA